MSPPPLRPRPWARLAHGLGDALVAAGLPVVRLDEAELLDEAERDTGLSDWGPSDFREGLSLFLRSANTQAKLGLIGRVMARNHVRAALSTRLRQIELARRHPDALERPVRRPIVIAACPRTGSTLMLRLLASHPDACSLPLWLGLSPMPPPDAATWRAGGTPQQRARADKTVSQTRAFIPQLQAIHEVGTDLPVECTYLMGPCFRTEKWWTNWPTYDYVDWLQADDMIPAYRWYVQALKLIQRELPGTHWVLKAPMHFRRIVRLHEALPNALIVHLHRDPARVIPSIDSMLRLTHSLTARESDAEHRVRTLMQTFAIGAREMLTLRERVGDERFMDLAYREVTADPVAAARRICERADVRWDGEVEATLRAHADANRAGKHGRHTYTPADSGMTAATIRAAFADYIEHHGVDLEAVD